jgi:excinuclease ABC subunit A
MAEADSLRTDASCIRIRGARQNNLKNLDLDIPTNELVVVTGVSGSGKSSLVFDTLYAEGQRRYVETFSPYARQFLDRMDKPQVDRIEGVPPAIAIDQTNPVRTSRSTVGTMTELNDHIKLLFARVADLVCRRCAQPVRHDTAESIHAALTENAARDAAPGERIVLTFPVAVPANFGEEEIRTHLEQQGYTRIHGRRQTETGPVLDVIQDRFRLESMERTRAMEAIEACLRLGQGRMTAHLLDADGNERQARRFSAALHCATDDLDYSPPTPSLFSFNSPIGACDSCRGFGRVIGVDYGLVIPDEGKTLAGGAIKPWQTKSFKECQDDLAKHARKNGVALDVRWRDLPPEHRRWVLEGDEGWVNWDKSWPGKWYGVQRYFEWLESKAYKMHIRVLLSKYRAYTPCTTCEGARLKPDALLWRVGDRQTADDALGRYRRFRPVGVDWKEEALQQLGGLSIHDLMLLPIARVRGFFDTLRLSGALDEATDLLLTEIRARLRFLVDVGLGYLTLDRQSRTLSGGEVQRINLTTALGTSLVNTLFVLDEPSIGLHPRDMNRIIGVMHRLKRAGNSLVVVEHDPQIMFQADRILDIGPGPGERGGDVVFFGTPQALRQASTLTGDYLSGRRQVGLPSGAQVRENTPKLILEGARAHNLKNVSVSFPLNRLVSITGVSGSGKSTLVQDVLHAALAKAKGKATETPGAFDRLLGEEQLTDVMMVDQTPIGKTTRSNPCSYVGAFDAIRTLFSRAEVARERGYTAGTFSFNSGDGRCPTCGGNGFEHVEMQFLSDVYLRCPDCDGKRYRPEVLEVMVQGKSIAQVLEMTVTEALDFFHGPDAPSRDVRARLVPLADVGLEYVRLGQPVPTLSGGEAQRLKLAGHLAEAALKPPAARGTLFLFDEPTTGLHFDDVAKLLRAFRKLLDAGHSLIVIEHNLDVIRASDWIVDMGPEGGDAGGEVVAVGTPQDVMQDARSHTGAALKEYLAQLAGGAGALPAADAALDEDAGMPLQTALRRRAAHSIVVHNAREHNLKNVDVEIPRDRFTVITGVSGSGKSTLAFDIVFGEGQRRYLESLNAYARQFVQPSSRPDVDGVFGIPPTVAIEQRISRGGRKSTVATQTEIYHFLRLLFVKLGTQHCPDCGIPIEPQSFDAIAARILRDYRGQHIGLLAPLVVSRKGYYTDLAKWAHGKGFSHLRVDGAFVPTAKWPRLDRYTEHTIELPVADLVVGPENEAQLRKALQDALDYGKGTLTVVSPLDSLIAALNDGHDHAPLQSVVFSTKRACRSCGKSFAELDPRLFSFNSKHGWCPGCFGTGSKLEGFDAEQSGEEGAWTDNTGEEGTDQACAVCDGKRLNRVALAVRFGGRSIADVTAEPVADVGRFFEATDFSGREAEIARDILAEIRARLRFLQDVGLGYLALDRAAPTLSGGEAQRIRLAAQLGSNLQGVCYVLDEPTIGLHPRDNRILLDTLHQLQQKGNTLLVVEHDEDTIRRADHVIDIGPGAGSRGGQIIAYGSAQELMTHADSITGRFLAQPLQHPLHPRRAVDRDAPSIQVKNATLHNLRGVDGRIPLGRLTVITGVSGSGKSTFARDVLLANMQRLVQADRRQELPAVTGCEAIEGWDAVQRVLEVDQTPIGKTPRSCPATYVGFWDNIRRLFADTLEARARGYNASRFSFNTGEGRCPACEGAGVQTIEMNFLPDVKVGCDVCNGQRFNRETLAIRMRDKSIGEVLAMSVDEAVEFFSAHAGIHHTLRLLQDVGLGYLTLGQQSPTLSGGEAQRIKLVTELAKVRSDAMPVRGRQNPHTLYVLDEPTVGLHMADVEKLIHVLHRLVDAGNTVVVIEHDIDLWAEADWIVDLGPEGGAGGGQIVAQSTPEELVRKPGGSHTAQVLADFLRQRAA